jgi:type II secretory pathway pseudopilin PulG
MELLLVIIMTSILAGIFAETLSSAIQIYSDHNVRKSALLDARRAIDAVVHDMREFRTWQNAPTNQSLDFTKANMFQATILFWTRQKYDYLRVGYNFDGGSVYYQRNEDGNWSNQYLLMTGGSTVGSQFSIVNQGGIDRITLEIIMNIEGRPLRFRAAAYPRVQGG